MPDFLTLVFHYLQRRYVEAQLAEQRRYKARWKPGLNFQEPEVIVHQGRIQLSNFDRVLLRHNNRDGIAEHEFSELESMVVSELVFNDLVGK